MTTPLDAFPLRPARVHEAFGPGATAFAALACAHVTGDLLWLRESWRSDALNPVALTEFFDPSRMLLAEAPDQTEVLAAMEEALRDGAVALVVAEVFRPLDLRAGRRLQLAAEAGRSSGLCLIAEGAGSNAAETRWHVTPRPGTPGTVALHAELVKNKSGATGIWALDWAGHRLRVDGAALPPRPAPQRDRLTRGPARHD